jgi:hypothetical protein
MSFSSRIIEFLFLIELFMKRQGRIRNIASIVFYDVIYPLGLYFSFSKIINYQNFENFISGLLVLFVTTYIIQSVTTWLGMDKSYNYFTVIRALGPSVLEYSIALTIVIIITSLPGILILTSLSLKTSLKNIALMFLVMLTSALISGFISTIIVTIFNEYTISTVFSTIFSYIISTFPPIFYPSTVLPSPWDMILNYIYTVVTANAIKSLLIDNLLLWYYYYLILLIYLIFVIIVFYIILDIKYEKGLGRTFNKVKSIIKIIL